MLKKVVIGYCDDLTTNAHYYPVVEFFKGSQGGLKVRSRAEGQVTGAIDRAVLTGVLDGTYKLNTLEEVIAVFSQPQCTLTVVEIVEE